MTGNDSKVARDHMKVMKSFMHIGASMYTIGIQFLAMVTWATNLSWARKSVKEGNIFNKANARWAQKKGNLQDLMEVVESGYAKKRKTLAFDTSSEEKSSSSGSSCSSEEERVKKRKSLMDSSESEINSRKKKKKKEKEDIVFDSRRGKRG